jgi:hypothetical protein
MHLEDRVVPGEMFGTSMLWAMGAFADPAALMPDNYPTDRYSAETPAPAQRAEFYAPSLPYVDASTLSVCQLDTAAVSDSGSTQSSETVAADTPVATGTTDQALSQWNPGTDFGTDFDSLAPASGSMGDLLHPGANTPAAPNAPGGATSGVQAPVLFFSGTPAGASSAPGNALGAALASLAGSLNGGGATSAMQAAAPSQGQAAAADSGGSATPLFHARAVAAPNAVHPFAANGTAPFSPAQIRKAYGIDQLTNQGAGQTIYIVDAYNNPNLASNLHTFDVQWGLPDPTLTIHKMSSRISNNTSWGFEESLDVQWAHAIAPQASITLVEATSSSTTALFSAVDWATNNGAHIVSMSFGATDGSGDTGSDSHFNHSGVTYIASSGDTGAAVEYPAASPYVLSVGGTSLTLNTDSSYASETAWSAGGGGFTTNESLPGYQSSYGITNGGRSIPDVSFDADPNTGVYVYDTFVRPNGGWFEVGGTSLSAPSWGGLIALVNQSRSTPLTSNNLTSRTEYNAATGTVYASNYHDITTGSNGHPAGPGYDLATGVGTPQANNLVPWLINNN